MNALTSTANVDVQIALDDRAVLHGLRGVHRVDDRGCADLVTQAIAGVAQHTVCAAGAEGKAGTRGKRHGKTLGAVKE